MEDINFTRGKASRLRFERNGSPGIDVDFFDETGSEWVAGRYLNEKDVKDLVEFLAPSGTPETAPTTERVNSTWVGLQVGDRIVEFVPDSGGIIVERQVPAKPAEPEFGFGTAYVFGGPTIQYGEDQRRYRGFKSTSGRFYYLTDGGNQRSAHDGQYEDFRLAPPGSL